MITYIEKGPYLHAALEAAGLHLSNQGGIWMYDPAQETAIQNLINTFNPLPPAQADAIAKINAAVDNVLAKIVAPYPPLEKDTWSIQVAEASVYAANNMSATPMLSDIALNSGQTVAALAANVLNKLSVYRAACAIPIGQRIKFTTQVYAATDCTTIAGLTASALAAIGV